MATLTATLAAVADLLEPLVDGVAIRRVYRGEQDQINEYPALEVRLGPGTLGRNPEAGMLERQQSRTGVVRVWIPRIDVLSAESAKFAPIIDAVEAAFGADPMLGGLAERFDATSHSGIGYTGEQNNFVFVDITWLAISIEPDTFEQDW